MIKLKFSKTWLAALLYSLILFSGFTTLIFDVGGKYILEAAVAATLLCYALLKDSIGNAYALAFRKKKQLLAMALILIIPFALIGWLRTGDGLNAYTDLRANYFLVIGFILSRTVFHRNKDAAYKLAVCTSLLYIIEWLIDYKSGNLGVKNPVPLFATVIASLLAIESGAWQKILFCLGMLIFLALVSFFRQYWIIAFFVLILCIGSTFFSNGSKFNRTLPIIILGVLFTLGGFGFISELFNSNESLYIQSIGKSQDALRLMEGGEASDSDRLRVNYFVYMLENWINLIIPHGLGYKSNPQNFDPWFSNISDASNTIDSLLLFITYHYGYIALLPIILWFTGAFIKIRKTRTFFEWLLLFLILLIPLLFDGGQATVPMRAFWFGSFLGYMFLTPKKIISSHISYTNNSSIQNQFSLETIQTTNAPLKKIHPPF